jgi:mRNA interferase RelE/StbE
MALFQPDIPPHVAEIIRHLPPDVKRSLRHALRALSVAPDAGEPLRRELEGLWKYRVRRFRIVYAIDHDHRRLRIVAVGHRREIYAEAAAQLRQPQPLQ